MKRMMKRVGMLIIACVMLLMQVAPTMAESGEKVKRIETLYIENVKTNIHAGENPVCTATVRPQDQNLYKITFQGWEKESNLFHSERKITSAFEEGETYYYHVRLELTDEAREQGYSLPLMSEPQYLQINGKSATAYGKTMYTSSHLSGFDDYEWDLSKGYQAYRADFMVMGTKAQYADGLQKNANGKWYYYKGGVIDKKYTGFAKNPVNGKYYVVRKGVLDWKFTGVAKNPANGKWYFARKGRLNKSFTGVAKSITNRKWYFVRKGVLDRKYTGLAKSVANGKLYYVRKGRVNWKFSGRVKYHGRKYRVVKGRVR